MLLVAEAGISARIMADKAGIDVNCGRQATDYELLIRDEIYPVIFRG